MPQRSIEALTNWVPAFVVVPDVQHSFSAPCVLDQTEELVKLVIDLGCWWSATAVARQFETHGGWKCSGFGWGDGQEVARL